MKTIKLTSQPKYVYYIEQDGKRIEVQRKIADPEHFAKLNITVYEWSSTTKEGATETNYSVALEDYRKNKPTANRISKDSIKSLLANCKDASELQAMLLELTR